MKIGGKWNEERTTYTYIDKQIHTVRKTWYEEKQRKGNQRRERERTWKRRKYSSRYPNRGTQSLERINRITEILSFLSLLFFTTIQISFRNTNLLESLIIKSLIQLFEFVLINPLRSRLFSLGRINNSMRFPAQWFLS